MPEPVVRRERIAQALLACLQAGLAPVVVERNRRAAVTAEEAPHVALFDGGHATDYTDEGDTTYVAEFGIECAVSGSADADLAPSMNALYGRIIQAVMADPSLDGLCVQVRETRMDVTLSPPAESLAPLVFFSLGLEAEFHTPDGDPAG